MLLCGMVLVGCSKQDAEIQKHIAEINAIEEQELAKETEDSEDTEGEEATEENIAIEEYDNTEVEAVAETETTVAEEPTEEVTEETSEEVAENVDVDLTYQYDIVEVTAILDDYLAVTDDTVAAFAEKYCVKPYSVVPAAPYGVTDYSVGEVLLKSGTAEDYVYTLEFHGLCSDLTGDYDRDCRVTFKFHGNKLYDATTEVLF